MIHTHAFDLKINTVLNTLKCICTTAVHIIGLYRYSGKLNVPTSDMPVLLKLPIPSTAFNRTGVARVNFAVRASIAGTTVGIIYHNYTVQTGGPVPLYGLPPSPIAQNRYITASNGWKALSFEVAVRDGSDEKAQRYPPLQLWVQAPPSSAASLASAEASSAAGATTGDGVGSGVKVWVDAISVVML